MISNTTGEYLKAHAEVESEGSILPYHQLPEYKAFEQRWAIFTKILGSTVPVTEHEKNIAENWFLWGYTTARLMP